MHGGLGAILHDYRLLCGMMGCEFFGALISPGFMRENAVKISKNRKL